MKIISFVCTVGVTFSSTVPFVVRQMPSIICAYAGIDGAFRISIIPARCEAVLYSSGVYNQENPRKMASIYKAIKSAGKTAYVLYTPENGTVWSSMVTSDDPTALDSYFAPMITYLSENKIDGVFLGYLDYWNTTVPNYSIKINEIICNIKKCVPGIKVGIYLSGGDAEKFPDKSLFDFSVTNDNVDVYLVDMYSAGRPCASDSLTTGGRLPITYPDSNVLSLEKVSNYTASSGMDLNKVMINLIDLVTALNQEPDSYKNYCSKPDPTACVESIELLYNQVIYVKKVFKGILISYLDSDDGDNYCKCGPYPVANTFMDAWHGKPMTCCEKIG